MSPLVVCMTATLGKAAPPPSVGVAPPAASMSSVVGFSLNTSLQNGRQGFGDCSGKELVCLCCHPTECVIDAVPGRAAATAWFGCALWPSCPACPTPGATQMPFASRPGQQGLVVRSCYPSSPVQVNAGGGQAGPLDYCLLSANGVSLVTMVDHTQAPL